MEQRLQQILIESFIRTSNEIGHTSDVEAGNIRASREARIVGETVMAETVLIRWILAYRWSLISGVMVSARPRYLSIGRDLEDRRLRRQSGAHARILVDCI